MKTPKDPIYVTQPALPELEDFYESLKEIWDKKWITNQGDFHKEFELELAKHLGVKHISLFNNGTIALLTALQCLDIRGEVITTPYSFVATANSLIWNNLTPVFCDVDPVYGNLDPSKIEELITPNTAAILPVHVYGNPCDTEAIQKIANTHNLKVIYDAAHAFGVEQNDKSILNAGDLSILSFHATKVFNTIEGGAIICHDEKTKEQVDFLKNFGIADETTVVAPGINGKMNELQAAYGLLQLKSIKNQIKKRKEITNYYRKNLLKIKGIRILDDVENTKYNYSYFPIFINDKDFHLTRDELFFKLREKNIYGRRYFHPLITDFPTYKNLPSSNLINAKNLADEVICLPIYPDLTMQEVDYILEILNNA